MAESGPFGWFGVVRRTPAPPLATGLTHMLKRLYWHTGKLNMSDTTIVEHSSAVVIEDARTKRGSNLIGCKLEKWQKHYVLVYTYKHYWSCLINWQFFS